MYLKGVLMLPKLLRVLSAFAVAGTCCLPAVPAHGQTAAAKALANFDGALSATGELTTSVTGSSTGASSKNGSPQTESPSISAGGLLSFRYTHSNLVGFEANYKFTRFNETFAQYLPGGSQTNAHEFTFGYILHGPTIFGAIPFGGVGAGSIYFKPTYKGGQAVPPQVRMAYYATVGLDDPIFTEHFGVRLQVRDLIYKAPDFLENYLFTGAHAQTIEPTIGVYYHF